MPEEIRIAMIGLDTSHAPAFTRCLQAPDCPADQKVSGARVVTCLRFSTPFQSEDGLDERQGLMDAWGVAVTRDFDEAVADCDAIAIEINDPSFHLDYFTRCAGLGKPIFLDKPLADSIDNARAICRLAEEKGVRVFSSSSLRYASQLTQACDAVQFPKYVYAYGPVGRAAAGSSIVWYGVHAFEMLQRAMGRGAKSVSARRDSAGVVAVVDYDDARRGIVELTEGASSYGGCVRDREKVAPFLVDTGTLYRDLLVRVVEFFHGGEPPVEMRDALEVMALLDAAERSAGQMSFAVECATIN